MKEKEKELVNLYMDLLPFSNNMISIAKKMAKIAVNELIESFKQLSIEESGRVKIDFGHGYWESVLKEIDNI